MKKRITITAALLTLAVLLSACTGGGGGQTNDAYRKVSAEEAHTMMSSESVLVVDVRRADEYEEGHIPGAINIPNEDIGTDMPAQLPDKDAAIIVYCRSGVRSKQAADKLVSMGYTQIIDMGGFVDWSYEVATGTEPGEYKKAAILGSFLTTDIEGNEMDAAMFADYELNVINVWATFCGPCLREMPDLGELAEVYRDKGVQIVGIVSDTLGSDGSISASQVQLARDIVEETGAHYPHLLPSQDLFGLLSQIYAVPTTFFVDSEGRQVGSVYVRMLDRASWEQIIEETLAEVRG